MSHPAPRRTGVLGFVRRWRNVLVLVPLTLALLGAAAYGARMLTADVPREAGHAGEVLCWDGARHPRAACGLPSGVEGLRWVFPGFDPDDPACRQVAHPSRGGRPVPVEWRCTTRVDGDLVRVTYTRRTTTEAGLTTLRRTYRDVVPRRVAGGRRLLWRSPGPVADDGRLTATEAYARLPFSLTVSAPTASARDTALTRLARFRAPRDVSVRPGA